MTFECHGDLASWSRSTSTATRRWRPDEGFTVTLSQSGGRRPSTTAAAAGTITNDDALPPPTLAIAATTPNRRQGGRELRARRPFTFTVTRSGDTQRQYRRSTTRSAAAASQCGRRGGLRRRHVAQRQCDVQMPRTTSQAGHDQRQRRHDGGDRRRLHGHAQQSGGRRPRSPPQSLPARSKTTTADHAGDRSLHGDMRSQG